MQSVADDDPSMAFDSTYTFTYVRMNKIRPSIFYRFFCGYRGMDFFYHTQSQGTTSYMIKITMGTLTGATLKSFAPH